MTIVPSSTTSNAVCPSTVSGRRQPRHLARNRPPPKRGGLGGRSAASQPVVFHAVAAHRTMWTTLPPRIAACIFILSRARRFALWFENSVVPFCLGTHVVPDFIKPLHFRLDARDGDLFPLHRRGEAAEQGGRQVPTRPLRNTILLTAFSEAVAVRLAGVLVLGGRLGDLGNVARDDPFVGIDRVDLCRGGEDAREKGRKMTVWISCLMWCFVTVSIPKKGSGIPVPLPFLAS